MAIVWPDDDLDQARSYLVEGRCDFLGNSGLMSRIWEILASDCEGG